MDKKPRGIRDVSQMTRDKQKIENRSGNIGFASGDQDLGNRKRPGKIEGGHPGG